MVRTTFCHKCGGVTEATATPCRTHKLNANWPGPLNPFESLCRCDIDSIGTTEDQPPVYRNWRLIFRSVSGSKHCGEIMIAARILGPERSLVPGHAGFRLPKRRSPLAAANNPGICGRRGAPHGTSLPLQSCGMPPCLQVNLKPILSNPFIISEKFADRRACLLASDVHRTQ